MAEAGYFIPVRVRRGIGAGLRWTLFPFSAYWRTGGSEPDIAQTIGAYGCRTGQVCWDIGAHFGLYALAMARAVGPTGKVIAVEPDPYAVRCILRHTKLNGLDSVLTVLPAGASDRTATLELHQPQGPGASTSHFFYADEPWMAAQRVLCVPTVALDELVSAKRIPPPDFIKIDAEGHAGKALAGSRNAIADSSPVIVVSYHGGDERACE
jgi:FkbM family methyltransferase